MKNLSIIKILVLLAGLAGGVSASDLPDCVGDDYASWNNCFGTQADGNGSEYVGQWKHGKRSGQGTFTFASGGAYVGEWKDGRWNGQGALTYSDGSKFVGGFKDGKRHGTSTSTYPDGTIEDGIWKDDVSVIVFPVTEVTVPEVSAASASDLPDCPAGGIRHYCFGTFTDANGDKYVGEWKDGVRYGQGTWTWPNGSEYVGQWKRGKRSGKGTQTWRHGGGYAGEWKDGRWNGQGALYSSDGTIKDGIWKDDVFLGTVAYVEGVKKRRIAELARQEEDKYERIYNACLLDKSPSVDMSVTSVEKAVKATCASIAEDPSFLEGFRYD